tara:strand:- start:1644 stop:2243 length:600 start_codon:yes stop_codon:yes gene_type:complete
MNKISPELAEILGLLCAEGCHVVSYCSYWGRERNKPRYYKNKKSERIEFYNKDEKLLFHYQKLLHKEFDHTSKITKHGKINIGNRNIIRKIIEQTELGHLKWRIPDSVISSNRKIKISFLRGFFDGDGTAISVVRMFSTNKKGLDQISLILKVLGFRHTVQNPVIKPNRKPHYVLQLSMKDQTKFLEEVKPISKLPRLR